MPAISPPDEGPPVPLETVDVTPLQPGRFAEVLTGEGYAQFEETIAAAHALLGTRTIWNVNSTAFGGGVAEMLRSLIGYVRGAGLDGRWVVADGDPEFFHITKRLHNRLHGFAGDGGPLGDAERAAYEHRCWAPAACGSASCTRRSTRCRRARSSAPRERCASAPVTPRRSR